MPDTFSLSLVIIVTYYAWKYLEKHKPWIGVISLLLIGLGILSKIPSICFLTLLLIPLFLEPVRREVKIRFLLGLLLCMILVVAWYGFWMPYLEETYHNKLIWPVSLHKGWNIFIENLNQTLYRFRINAFHQAGPFWITLAGLIALVFAGKKKILLVILAYSILFFLFILKTGHVFHTHNYYVIPYIPVMCVSIGYFFSRVKIHKVDLLLIALAILSHSIAQNHKDWIARYNERFLTLQAIVDKYIQKEDKVMVNGGVLNPTMMHFTGRRGWTVNNDVLSKVEWIPQMKEHGLKYIVVDRHSWNEILPYELLFENDAFWIYSLEPDSLSSNLLDSIKLSASGYLEFASQGVFADFIQKHTERKLNLPKWMAANFSDFVSYQNQILNYTSKEIHEIVEKDSLDVLTGLFYLREEDGERELVEEVRSIFFRQILNRNAALKIGDQMLILTHNKAYMLNENQYKDYVSGGLNIEYLYQQKPLANDHVARAVYSDAIKVNNLDLCVQEYNENVRVKGGIEYLITSGLHEILYYTRSQHRMGSIWIPEDLAKVKVDWDLTVDLLDNSKVEAASTYCNHCDQTSWCPISSYNSTIKVEKTTSSHRLYRDEAGMEEIAICWNHKGE